VLGKLGIVKVAAGPDGASIIELTPNGAAERAGLKQNDFIRKMNGLPVTSADVITNAVRASLTRQVTLDVLSDEGLSSSISVSLDPVL
jgi:putative serine protease PepD